MTNGIAAFPMYDWPEAQAEVDAFWRDLRERLRQEGVDAPERLARRNADLPPVPGGGIRDAEGRAIAPDPAVLPPDEFDLAALWRHPKLLVAQTCWGPMELGLAPDVTLVGQPDYSAFEGGQGAFYSSAILMRRADRGETRSGAPAGSAARLPIHLFRGKRFAFNDSESMSGHIGLARDLEALGESLDIFSERLETGAHRASIRAVAEGRADVCAIDCRSWTLARRFEPAATELAVVGWTAKRLGPPFIASRHLPPDVIAVLRSALQPSSLASSG